MTALDTKFRATALKLIAKNGAAITLTRTTPGSYNTSTGSATNSTATQAAKALVEEYKAGEMFVSNGLITTDDKKFTIAASAVTRPNPGDTITLGTTIFTIVAIKEVWSGEQVALYIVQARS